MSYSKEIIDQCFTYYAEGHTFTWIEKNYKKSPNRRTLTEWSRTGDWKQRKEEITKKSNEIIGENLAEMKAKHRKVITASIINYLHNMRKGKLMVKPNDVANLMKHELLLAGEATDRVENIKEAGDFNEFMVRLTKEKLKNGDEVK